LLPVQQENQTGLDIAAIPMESVRGQLRSIRDSSRHLPFSILEHPQLTHEDAKKYYTKTTERVFYDKCLAPWRNVAITPKGEVIITPMCFDYPLGNVKKDSFSHIWNGTRLKTFRRKLKNAGSYPACVRCCLLFDSKPKYYKLKDLL
jgi:radical SAM protein with 4Fe4S-binding SPASM domain